MVGQAKRLFELTKSSSDIYSERSGKIVAFTSGKGGTGKSFLVSNLAYIISSMNKKVLIIDLDLNLSNLHVFYNIKSSQNLYSYLTSRSVLEDIIYEYNENLHMILGESGKINHPSINEFNVESFFKSLNKLAQNYDYIFLDTSSGANKTILSILLSSDIVNLVTTPEPTSIMDSYVVLKLLKNNGANNYKGVIINKCLSPGDGNTAFGNLEKAATHFLKENINYLGYLNFSMDSIYSIQNQRLLSQHNQSSSLSTDLTNLSSNFVKHMQLVNNNH